MKSWKMPTPDQIDRAVSRLGRFEHYRYFFDKLENPTWIKPLWAKGFFRNPPSPERDDTRGTIRFPPWPESRYLARMTPHAPNEVLEIILEIPDTENFRVHEDLADAALAMPPEIAARLLEKTTKLASVPGRFLLPEKLGKLVVHLAKGGQADVALNLARVLLEVLPDPESEEKSKNLYSLSPDPRARMNKWDYEQIAKKNIPELVKAAGVPAFELLCDLLESAVRFSRRHGEEEKPEDSSYIWRPAIEDHEQNEPNKLEDTLVSAVRDAAVYLTERGDVQVQDLIQKLEERDWYIFRRMALYLLGQSPGAPPEFIVKRLTDRKLFDALDFQHEYALLLRAKFGTLPHDQQQIILGWIETGPDIEEFKEWEKKGRGRQPTGEEIDGYRKHWQLKRLAWFHTTLPDDWKRRYQALVVELGEPEHPDIPVHIKFDKVGRTSPKSAEELKTMTVSEIVTFLGTWNPPKVFMAPSPEDLGLELSQAVVENPNRFISELSRIQGLSPTYVYAVLSGLRDALGQKKTFDWSLLLDFCRWVVTQPQGTQGDLEDEKSGTRKWVSARQTIAEMLASGFKEGPGCISYNLRETVWEVLQPLTEDPHPTPEYEARYGGANMEPATLSINTTRGQAVHTVLQYALWIRRYLEKLPDAKGRLARKFDEMPEVRTVLEEHLDPARDPSLAIRAVYGQWFPWLVLIDPVWVKEHVAQIFPADETNRSFWYAAWNTYITFCHPYDNAFDAIKDCYDLALNRMGEVPEGLRALRDAEEQLAEHLMVYYWRGRLDWDPAAGLLTRFWQKAPDELRGHAIEFIGRSLHNTEGTVPSQILQRMVDLWERRLAEAKSAAKKEDYSSEMAGFGWWFVSKKLDVAWAVSQLLEALKISGKIEPDDMVVEHLADIASQFPKETVQCLECLAKGDCEGWHIYHWRKEIRVILSHAIQCGGEAGELAEDLVHYIGSRGYLEFRLIVEVSG